MSDASTTELLLAAIAFTGGHFLISSTPLRPALVARLGDRMYQGAYSLVALATLVWLAWSYLRAPFVELWPAPVWARHLALTLMPFVLILLAASLRLDNPTAVGAGASRLERLGIFSITRHPMMWAVTLWAAVHILANGDLASLIFFGALLVLALFGTIAIDAKQRVRQPEAFADLAARTSNLPFAAMLSGRTRFSGHRLLPAVVIGLLLYGALVLLHPYLFGVSLLPG